MNNQKFRIVLIDADDTIFDFKKAEYSAFKKTLNSFGADCTDKDVEVYSNINLSCWKELEKGTLSRNELQYKRFELWFDYMGLRLDAKAFNEIYVPSLGEFGYLIDGAEEFLRKLSNICDVYIVTNGMTITQESRFEKTIIKPYIKKLFVSESIGYSKPDKAFFDFCINEIGEADRSEYIIIGDSLSSDMQGGRNAGISTCLFSRDKKIPSHPLCDYVISDYNSFFDILY